MSKKSEASARRERAEQMRRERERKERRGKIIFTVGTVIGVAAIAGLVAWAVTSERTKAEIADLKTVENQGRDHVTGSVAAGPLPPTGGDHSQVVANCGVYSSPIPVENALHSMEHGAVWVTYQPSLPQSDVSALDQVAQGQSHVLVSPYPDQPSPVVATAWGQQVELSGVSDPRLQTFVKTYQNGSQAPEPNAPCSGGIGTPENL